MDSPEAIRVKPNTGGLVANIKMSECMPVLGLCVDVFRAACS